LPSVPLWAPEIEVDEPLVRRLLGEQLGFHPRSLRLHASGWDNSVWVVDETWAFRFPRRQIAIPGVEREIAVLPAIAAFLPLRIPVPEHVGLPADGYPWPFFGCRFIEGAEVAAAALDDAARSALAEPLGRFLRALHAPRTAAAAGAASLPVDPNRRADVHHRVALTREWLAALVELGLWRPAAAAERLLDAALALPPPEPLTLVHGDLHQRHLLVAQDGAAAGVIDWGDVCVADPCIDLPLVYSLLPPTARERFFATYGPVSDAQRTRARLLAVNLSAILARYAHDVGDVALRGETLAGIDRALA
jgi:aminoglycoside phosphotransferase (APT) family kinase protein